MTPEREEEIRDLLALPSGLGIHAIACELYNELVAERARHKSTAWALEASSEMHQKAEAAYQGAKANAEAIDRDARQVIGILMGAIAQKPKG